MRQESRGAKARYADALGPALDPSLLHEVLTLLHAYPDLIEARILGTGPKAEEALAPGGMPPGKKKLTPAEVKVGR